LKYGGKVLMNKTALYVFFVFHVQCINQMFDIFKKDQQGHSSIWR